MSYMRTLTVMVGKGDPLFSYAGTITALANNLSNAARFRQRQLMTAAKKPVEEWSDNESEVVAELITVYPDIIREGLEHNSNLLCSYYRLEELMRGTDNPDFFANGLSRQCSQHILRQAAKDMKSFFSAVKAYNRKPEHFTGRPELPGYKKKGGHTTVFITNQDCVISEKDGRWYAAFPLIKEHRLCIGHPVSDARLKEVTVTPDHGRYRFCFKFEVYTDLPMMPETSARICAVDFGVNNLMAITNNCGLPCILYKGGIIKSVNQLYNKTAAGIVSSQTKSTGKKFAPDEKYTQTTHKRNDTIDDHMHKYAKHLVTWCVENRIDTIVLGSNAFWKQEVSIGNVNNQNFVQIPFDKLKNIISYLCERSGIRCIEQEESYTSKSSFLDMDPIPVYKKGDDTVYHFSGRRYPTRYKGMHKADGFRGLYRSADGTIISSDLNGSANILRKAFPDAFIKHAMPDFSNIKIIRHPDKDCDAANRQKQKKLPKTDSHAKAKRHRRKANAA